MRESANEGVSQPLLYRSDGVVATLCLNRPDARNALDDDLQDRLIEQLESIARDADLRVVILTGAGESFCAGGDIKGMRGRLQAEPGQVAVRGLKRLRRTHAMITLLDDLDKVTIAAVNGHAVGVGMDLAICCDFVLASEAAIFAASYVLRGLVPDGGGMYYLPRRVGLAHAKELIYSGRSVNAPEALRLGLADRLAAPSELESTAQSWARELAKSSPIAVALAKRVLNRTFDLTRDEVLARSAEVQAICYTTDEHRDAVAEFLAAREARSADD